MSSLQILVESATEALRQVNPENLSVDRIQKSRETLESLKVGEAIGAYSRSLPPKPDDEKDQAGWEKNMHELGKTLNHAIHGLNDELNRIKNLRHTLDLAALDPLILAAQSVVRPLYDFTAGLSR